MASLRDDVYINNNFIGDYKVEMHNKLGKGSYGIVYKGMHKITGIVCAAKEIDFQYSEMVDPKLVRRTETELEILKKLQGHNNIVKLYDTRRYQNCFWIFLEHCDGGNLRKYLIEHATIGLLDKLRIGQQCASAVAFMHGMNPSITHRDIKLENILISQTGDEVTAKVADFGFSKILDELTDSRMRSHLGTRYYMAPEQFARHPYDKSVDVYSLGLVFLVMYNFSHTYMETTPLSAESRKLNCKISIGAEMLKCHEDNMQMPILFNSYSEIKPNCEFQKLIVSMTMFDSKFRPRMKEVEGKIFPIIEDCKKVVDTLINETVPMRSNIQFGSNQKPGSIIQTSEDDSLKPLQCLLSLGERSTKNNAESPPSDVNNLRDIDLGPGDTHVSRHQLNVKCTSAHSSFDSKDINIGKENDGKDGLDDDMMRKDKAKRLTKAVITRDDKAIQFLLKDISIKSWISDHVAIGDVSITPNDTHELTNYTHTSALAEACRVSTLAVVRQLVEAGAQLRDVNSLGESALLRVCYSRTESLDKAKYLVERDDHLPYIKNNFDEMPIHRASYQGQRDLITYFISLGIDVDSPGQHGSVPVLHAARGENFTCIELLVAHGANHLLMDTCNRNILHWAANGVTLKCAKSIIETYAMDINATSHLGSALHHAAMCGRLDTVKLLCSLDNCKILLVGPKGLTPAACAEKFNHPETAAYLHNICYRKAMQKYTVKLVQQMNAAECVDYLFSNDVISTEDYGRLVSISDKKDKARTILSLLYQKPSLSWVAFFREYLKQNNEELYQKLFSTAL